MWRGRGRVGPLCRHHRQYLGWHAWHHPGCGWTASASAKGEDRSLCYGPSAAAANQYDHAAWSDACHYGRTAQSYDEPTPIAQEIVPAVDSGPLQAPKDRIRRRIRPGRSSKCRFQWTRWHCTTSGSCAGRCHGVRRTVAIQGRTVCTLENSMQSPHQHRWQCCSGSPEGTYCPTLARPHYQGPLQGAETFIGSDNSCISQWHRSQVCSDYGNESGQRKHARNAEGCTSYFLYNSDHMLRLAYALHLFVAISKTAYMIIIAVQFIIYAIGRLTFLWGDHMTSDLRMTDFYWQVARIAVFMIGVLIYIANEDKTRRASRVTIGRHHEFRRGRRVTVRTNRMAVMMTVLLSNQNLLAAAQVAGALHGNGLTYSAGWINQATRILQAGLLVGSCHGTMGSFTDQFLQRSWPLTSRGEQVVAGALDPDYLRERWTTATTRFGLQRPVDTATFIIFRPPGRRGEERNVHFDIAHFDIARFDDPDLALANLAAQWDDTGGYQWRLVPIHAAYRESRSYDPTWHPFLLLTPDEQAERNLIPGLLDIASSSSDFEHSLSFALWLPAATTWAELSNWCLFDVSLPHATDIYVTMNGEKHLQQNELLGIDTGFFLQDIASVADNATTAGIPTRFCTSWPRLFARTGDEYSGPVYVVSSDRPFAMEWIGYQSRTETTLYDKDGHGWRIDRSTNYMLQLHWETHLGSPDRYLPIHNTSQWMDRSVFWGESTTEFLPVIMPLFPGFDHRSLHCRDICNASNDVLHQELAVSRAWTPAYATQDRWSICRTGTMWRSRSTARKRKSPRSTLSLFEMKQRPLDIWIMHGKWQAQEVDLPPIPTSCTSDHLGTDQVVT